MKLSVTGRYVDLDFGTVTPIRLSQKFANESVAQSAASAIAVQLDIEMYTVYSEKTQVTEIIRFRHMPIFFPPKKKQRRIHAISTKKARSK